MPLVRWALERLFKPSTQPELDPEDLAAIIDALRTATGGEVLRNVEWTHSISVSAKKTSARLLLQQRPGVDPVFAFASPRGPIAITAPAGAFGALDPALESVTQATIVGLGNKRVRATVYVGRTREGKPKPGYLETILDAARGWRLPAEYIEGLERWRASGWRGKHPAETGDI